MLLIILECSLSVGVLTCLCVYLLLNLFFLLCYFIFSALNLFNFRLLSFNLHFDCLNLLLHTLKGSLNLITFFTQFYCNFMDSHIFSIPTLLNRSFCLLKMFCFLLKFRHFQSNLLIPLRYLHFFFLKLFNFLFAFSDLGNLVFFLIVNYSISTFQSFKISL